MSPTVRQDWKTPARRRAFLRLFSASLREVGILLLAFTPLEASLRGVDAAISQPKLVWFLIVGLLLFAVGTFGEWRNDDGK